MSGFLSLFRVDAKERAGRIERRVSANGAKQATREPMAQRRRMERAAC